MRISTPKIAERGHAEVLLHPLLQTFMLWKHSLLDVVLRIYAVVRMSFAISLTVFAFATMDIGDCLGDGADANACLVANPTAHKQFLAAAMIKFLLLVLLVGHECGRVYLQGMLMIQLELLFKSLN